MKNRREITPEVVDFLQHLTRNVCIHCIANDEKPDACEGYGMLEALTCIKAILFANERI